MSLERVPRSACTWPTILRAIEFGSVGFQGQELPALSAQSIPVTHLGRRQRAPRALFSLLAPKGSTFPRTRARTSLEARSPLTSLPSNPAQPPTHWDPNLSPVSSPPLPCGIRPRSPPRRRGRGVQGPQPAPSRGSRRQVNLGAGALLGISTTKAAGTPHPSRSRLPFGK